MFLIRRFSTIGAATGLALAVLAPAMTLAQDNATAAETRIYQQRGPDGRIVLTDRPVPGAVTQRTWQAAPEDAAAARERREQARLDALAVSERIQKQLDADRQRDLELSLARARLAEADARVAAERARAQAAAQPVAIYAPGYSPVYGPGYFPRWPPAPTPGVRPGFPLRPPSGPSLHPSRPDPSPPPFVNPRPALPSQDPG